MRRTGIKEDVREELTYDKHKLAYVSGLKDRIACTLALGRDLFRVKRRAGRCGVSTSLNPFKLALVTS